MEDERPPKSGAEYAREVQWSSGLTNRTTTARLRRPRRGVGGPRQPAGERARNTGLVPSRQWGVGPCERMSNVAFFA